MATATDFKETDALFGKNSQEGYNQLKKKYDEGNHSTEVLYRLGRFCHELSRSTTDKNEIKRLLAEGKSYCEEGHNADKTHFECAKWAAVLSGAITNHLSTKEKIQEGVKFKAFLDAAIAINDKDATLYHLRGRFFYNVASLSWIERKLASAFYATPPSGTFEEAIQDLEQAYESKKDWIENTVWLAKAHLAKKDKTKAKKFFSEAANSKPLDAAEEELVDEAAKQAKKL